VTTLGSGDPPKKKGDDGLLVDFSQLASADDDATQIDTGVTSGADPSEWDPIDIDAGGRVDTCVSEDGKKSGDKSGPAVCQSAQPQK
jgi:hypothetical protein